MSEHKANSKDASPRDAEEARNHEANQADEYPTHEPINDPNEKKEEEKKASGGIMALGVVCAILEFFCLVLIVVATPLDIYKARVKPLVKNARSCYSMWGSKICGNHAVHRKGVLYHGFPCSAVNKTMTCAAAFAIISIFFTLVTIILCILFACKCMSPIIAGVFGLLSSFFLCITFACQCGVRNKYCGPLTGFIRTNYMYGPGFGITVTAFALQCVVTVLIFICMCIGGGSSAPQEDKEEKEKEKEEKKERNKDVDAVDKK